MSETRLYKYLDANGGLEMLKHSNLQGVCIGLDMDKAKPYLDNIQCSVFRGAY
jgi:hypothetical protein